MNYQQWKLFLDAYEQGSLSKVAHLNHTSQPKVSRDLNELETYCGGRLFHRTGRGVKLTDFGLFLLPKIRNWIKMTEQLQSDIHDSSNNLIGKVSIGSIPSTAYPLLTSVSKIIKQQFPQIELSVREGQGAQIDQWLDEGIVDIALLYRTHSAPQEGDSYLAEADTYLVCKKTDAFANFKEINFSQLDNIPLVTFCRPNNWVTYLDEMAKNMAIRLNIAFEADSLSMQMHLIENDGYYGIFAPQAIKNYINTPNITGVRIINPNLKRYLSLSVSSHTYLTPACKKVIETIKNTISIDINAFTVLN